MVLIEIKEEKLDGLVDTLGKASKMLGKAMQCVEHIRVEGRKHNYEDEYEQYDDEDDYSHERDSRYHDEHRRGRYSRY